MNYQQIAAGVYQRCNHFDPYLPPLSTDLARAWGGQFEKHRLTADDLLAGVDQLYDEHGSGFRPLAKDITDSARRIRRDRAERVAIEDRSTDPDWARYYALCESKSAEPKTPLRAAKLEPSAVHAIVARIINHTQRSDRAERAGQLEHWAVPLCRVCGAHPLLAVHEAERGICDWCTPAISNGHQPHPNGQEGTA
jgi:hypothetical protein